MQPHAYILFMQPHASQVWIFGESGTAIRPALAAQPILVTVSRRDLHVHISGMKLFGHVRVSGGQLSLSDCSIDGAGVQPTMGRALLISGGSAFLERTVLSDHSAGAVEANGAALIMIDSTIRDSHAQTGGAILADGGAHITIVNSNLTRNSASMSSGGALQVMPQRSSTYGMFPMLAPHDGASVSCAGIHICR
eukprot:1038649-Prymnesium_polylepis.1